MKKVLLSIVATFCLGVLAYSQPNPGFENWVNMTGQTSYEDPISWTTTNALNQTFFGGNPVSVFKATGVDKYSGTSACKITIIKQISNQTGGALPDTLGLIYTGTIGFSGPKFGYGYTSRPVSLDFYAKYTPTGADTAIASLFLTKWNTNKRDTVGIGVALVGNTSAFTKFSAVVYYKQSYNPDTANIIISAGGGGIKKAKTPKVGSALYVDDLNYIVTGISEPVGISNIVNVFPNPASDAVNFSATTSEVTTVEVYDLMGKKLNSYPFENRNVRINTSKFAVGMYTYSILSKTNDVISRGKFDVVR